MSCSHTTDCPLFAQFAMEPSLAVWKIHFCDSDFAKCARYQLSLKGAAVPITLMPNGKMIEAKVKSKEELGGTALFNAILKGRAAMVKSMISSKMATVEVTSSDGSTPLMAAASIGHLEIVNILLAAGCNPYIQNKDGVNALAAAESKNFPDCAKAILEFMTSNPDLENKMAETKTAAVSATEEEPKGKGLVGLLKKMIFSR
jgi:hypothetical protein